MANGNTLPPVGYAIVRKPTRTYPGVPEWVRRAQKNALVSKNLTGAVGSATMVATNSRNED